MEKVLRVESFNARYLSFEEVAESFIPNNEFIQLLGNNHSIVMGPRGCGKTTLLKMLFPMALSNCPNISDELSSIPFWGIYIPSDKHWDSQLQYMENILKDKPTVVELISKILVTINIIQATIKTFNCIIEINNIEELEDETSLANNLISILKLEDGTLPSLHSISYSLNRIVEEVNIMVKQEYYTPNAINGIELKRFLYLEDFLPLVSEMCDTFEFVYKKKILSQRFQAFKWALCFDELEISPAWLRERLFNDCLRSTNQKLLFKITSTPLLNWQELFVANQQERTIASENNDFSIIRTWVHDTTSKENWNKFCSNLFSNIICRKTGIKNIDLIDIFGRNDYLNGLRINDAKTFPLQSLIKNDFEKGSEILRLYSELAKKDDSFSSFLIANDIKLEKYDKHQIIRKKDLLRKIKPTVAFRFYSKGRSRKENHLYHGLPFIFELTDGNPRVAINLMNKFISRIHVENGEIDKISIPIQASILNEFSRLRLDYYKGYPNASQKVNGQDLTMGDLLEKIGNYFYAELVGDDFKAEPVTSFEVNNTKTSEGLKKLINLALNEGALLDLNPKEDPSINFSRRFRLSYILHPHFNLPKRVNRYISIDNILENTSMLLKKKKEIPNNQISISFNYETSKDN